MNLSSAIKALLPLVLLAQLAIADEPSLTHHFTIKEDAEKGFEVGELYLKVNNPTDRNYYVFGICITDIRCHVEVLKDGKWTDMPSLRCGGTCNSLRPILPHSYIVFRACELPLNAPDIIFRLRVFLSTEPSLDSKPTDKPWMQLVSPPFNSTDFRRPNDADVQLPASPSGASKSSHSMLAH